jgi:hypothetical protein
MFRLKYKRGLHTWKRLNPVSEGFVFKQSNFLYQGSCAATVQYRVLGFFFNTALYAAPQIPLYCWRMLGWNPGLFRP